MCVLYAGGFLVVLPFAPGRDGVPENIPIRPQAEKPKIEKPAAVNCWPQVCPTVIEKISAINAAERTKNQKSGLKKTKSVPITRHAQLVEKSMIKENVHKGKFSHLLLCTFFPIVFYKTEAESKLLLDSASVTGGAFWIFALRSIFPLLSAHGDHSHNGTISWPHKGWPTGRYRFPSSAR